MSEDFRNNPDIWKASCNRLLNTLKVIERGILNSEDQEIFDAELSAMMISGFAFENAFKAWYLREKGNLYENEKQVNFSGHHFTTWVAQNRIKLLGWEDEALEKAEFFCVAWGRYPAHNQRKKERTFETWGAGDIEQLKNLIQRLLDGTFTYK
jgi:hypothetical protein